ncbi:MAG: MtrB/PioB family decaheme-associated outer membrane protein [Sulfurimicrobium sp.]|nr:MtrB/PioB family decaheme-associated outer membrane protein [Sulfurimicrobium sp.]MDZ7657375.1 MtrB/PioB family decaheme-associated outer membrane protein [Sulfurimicrobium sp.]
MDHRNLLTHGKPIRLLVVCCSLAPVAALADNMQGQVSLGVAHANLDRPAAYFGKYTGISDDASWLMANLDLRYWSEKYYFDLSGNNLGLDNRDIGARLGRAGVFRLDLKHSEIPMLRTTEAQTPFSGVGSDHLTLPGEFQRGANIGAMTNIGSHLNSTSLRTDRSTEQLKFFITPSDRWRIEFGAEQYRLTGKKPLGTLMAFSTAAILPAPVDQQTNALSAAVNYRGEQSQWSASYKLSSFSNQTGALTWDNPFTGSAQGRLAAAPDNQQQTFNLTGSITLSSAHRLTVSAEQSRMEQNDSLLPYTINSSSAVPVTLPRDTAQARIDTTHINLNLTSKPLPKLTVNTRYRYSRNDNRTPSALFLRVVNDFGNQVAANNSLAAHLLPYDSSSQRLSVDSGYSLGKMGTIKLGLRQDVEEKDYRAVRKTTENTVNGGYSRRITDRANGEFSFEHARRNADSPYNQTTVYQSSQTQAYINTITDPALQFASHPLLRQFDIANRQRDKMALTFNLFPVENLMVGLNAYRAQDQYPDAQLGISSYATHSATLDIDYSPQEGYTLYGYVTRDNVDYALQGRQFGRFGAPANNYNNSDYDWTTYNHDKVTTLGLGGSNRLLNDRLLLKLKVTRTLANNTLQFSAGPALAPTIDLPNTVSTRDRIELHGDYKLPSGITLGLGTIYDRYHSRNWATDGIAPGSSAIPDVLALITPNNGFRAYTLYAMATYKW